MGGLLALVVVGHLILAAVEVPSLWGRSERRGELKAVVTLLVVSLTLALMVTAGYRPVSVWKGIEWVFKPIGTVLFKPGEG